MTPVMKTAFMDRLQRVILHDRFPLIVMLLAVIIRLAWMLLFQPEPVSDPAIYFSRALSIASGQGYAYADGTPTAYWPVGYSAFLALFIYLLGDPQTALIISNVLLVILLIIGFYQLALIALRDRLSARIALLLFAFYPDHIAYSSLATSELLASLLTIGYLAIVLTRHSPIHAVLAGAVLGLAALTKAQSLLLPVLVCLYFFWLARKSSDRLQALYVFAITMLVAVLVISPWSIRNHQLFDRFIAISTNGGVNLYIGNNPHATGRYVFTDEDKAKFAGLNELETSDKAKALAITYMRENPLQVLKRVPKKLFYLLRTDGDGLSWNQEGLDDSLLSNKSWRNLKIVATLYYYVILFVGLAAVIWALVRFLGRNADISALFGIIVFYYLAIYAVFFGAPRFHDIFIPFLILSASGLARRYGAEPSAPETNPGSYKN